MVSVSGRAGKAPLALGSFLLAAFGGVGSAQAVQAHGGAEGLVSHQLGHVLFVAGMAFLLFRIVRTRTSGPGWPAFKSFLWLIILWNLLTFVGHWLHEFVGPEKYVTADGRAIGYSLNGLFDLLFYLTRLDHLVLVPALLMLLAALRRWKERS